MKEIRDVLDEEAIKLYENYKKENLKEFDNVLGLIIYDAYLRGKYEALTERYQDGAADMMEAIIDHFNEWLGDKSRYSKAYIIKELSILAEKRGV